MRIPFSKVKNLVLQTLDDIEESMIHSFCHLFNPPLYPPPFVITTHLLPIASGWPFLRHFF